MHAKTPIYFYTHNAERYFSIMFSFAEPLRNPCRLGIISNHVSKTTRVILPQHIKRRHRQSSDLQTITLNSV